MLARHFYISNLDLFITYLLCVSAFTLLFFYLEGGESVLFIIFFSEILKDKPGRAEAAREGVEVEEMGQLLQKSAC